MLQYYIGVDLGGTEIVAGVVDKEYKIISKAAIKTELPCTKETIENKIYEVCLKACEQVGISFKKQIVKIGIGMPGSIDKQNGVVIFNANFAYRDWKIVPAMERLTGKSIYIENDANVAAVGEQLAGGAKGYRNVVMVTLGTGIGGGIIINNEVFTGVNNAAGEIGHMVIMQGGKQCMCGRKGCFEMYASARALTEMTRNYLQNEPDNIMWKAIEHNLENVNGKTAFDGVRAGDKLAIKIVNEYMNFLACGITNIINIFQPEVICVGGGISNEGNSLLEPLQNLLDKEEFTRDSKKRTLLRIAQLKNDAGVIGAAFLNNKSIDRGNA